MSVLEAFHAGFLGWHIIPCSGKPGVTSFALLSYGPRWQCQLLL